MDTYIHPAQFCITVLAKNIPDHVSSSELQIIMQNHSVQGRIQDFKRGGGWQTIFIEGC